LDHFLYRNGELHAEEVMLRDIAEAVGTPFYCYSTATLTRHYQLFTEALSPLPHLVCYAVKANSNLAVLKHLGELGAGMDVVSIGEYRRARAAGMPGERIVFSGVGKTRAEMRTALEGGIRQFNVESEPELEALSDRRRHGRHRPHRPARQPRRGRPHPREDRDRPQGGQVRHPARPRARDLRRAARLPGLRVVGIDMHIGSQLTDLAPFEAAYTQWPT
jgi:diaminopimelate decarboxylase